MSTEPTDTADHAPASPTRWASRAASRTASSSWTAALWSRREHPDALLSNPQHARTQQFLRRVVDR